MPHLNGHDRSGGPLLVSDLDGIQRVVVTRLTSTLGDDLGRLPRLGKRAVVEHHVCKGNNEGLSVSWGNRLRDGDTVEDIMRAYP